MQKRLMRCLALAMGILFLCPFLLPFVTVSADDAVSGTRFIFEVPEGDGYAANEDGSITLQASDTDRVFFTDGVSPMGASNSTNALYVSLQNDSAATVVLTVQYTCYSCNDGSNRHTASLAFASSSEKQAQWVYAPHISSLQSGSELELTLHFDGTVETDDTVTLYAFYDVSVYNPEEGVTGNSETAEIVKCSYEPSATEEGGTIVFSGILPPLYADDDSTTLALFAFGPDDQDTSNVITKTPVARMALNKNFAFSVPVKKAEEIYARYAVAVVTKEGERRLLCQPVYPDVCTEPVSDAVGFKGFHTDSIFTMLDGGVELGIVDVYLDRLLLPSSDSGNGILFAGDHSYYFFSETEIAALDHRIRNLTGHGCQVYLRFLVSPEAEGLSYVNQADSYMGIVNKGVDIKTETALLEIHALTDFLTQRYNNTAQGNISGIILGRAADRSSAYAYVGVQSLATYAEKYATYLNLVAGSARSNIPGLQIVVPISDRAHTDTVTVSNLTGDYFSDLFLDSLVLAMEDLILTPPAFSVMMQAAEKEEAKVPDDMESLDDFLAMVKSRAEKYDFLDEKIHYAWTPSSQYTVDELNAAYALRYITLFFDPDVSDFIVDLSLCDDARRMAERLKYLVSGIDTPQSGSVLESVTAAYPDAVASYDLSALITRSIEKVPVGQGGYTNGQTPIGSYPLFDFSQQGGQAAWYAGGSCDGVALIDRTLTAQLSATTGEEYAEIAYSFGAPKNYSVAPLMRFSLGIKAGEYNVQTPYEVQIRLIGNDSVLIGSAVIMAGDAHTLYLDLGAYIDRLEELRSIRVLARPLDGSQSSYELYLNSVYLESATLSSAELAEQISIQTNEAQPDDLPQAAADYTTPILVTGIVIVVSMAFVALLIVKYLRVRKRNNV